MFTDLNYWEQTDSRPNHGRKDKVEQAQLGFEYRFAPAVSFTAGGNSTRLRGDKFDPIGTYRLDGATGFVGFTFFFGESYNLNVTVGRLMNWIHETRPSGTTLAFTDKKNTGGFASATFNASYSMEKLRIAPFLNVLYYAGKESAGFESDGFFRAEHPDSLGRVGVGSEIYYRISIADFVVEPMVRAAFLYEYKLLNDWHDRTAFELAGGLNLPVNSQLTLAFRAHTILGRDDFQIFGARASIYYKF